MVRERVLSHVQFVLFTICIRAEIQGLPKNITGHWVFAQGGIVFDGADLTAFSSKSTQGSVVESNEMSFSDYHRPRRAVHQLNTYECFLYHTRLIINMKLSEEVRLRSIAVDETKSELGRCQANISQMEQSLQRTKASIDNLEHRVRTWKRISGSYEQKPVGEGMRNGAFGRTQSVIRKLSHELRSIKIGHHPFEAATASELRRCQLLAQDIRLIRRDNHRRIQAFQWILLKLEQLESESWEQTIVFENLTFALPRNMCANENLKNVILSNYSALGLLHIIQDAVHFSSSRLYSHISNLERECHKDVISQSKESDTQEVQSQEEITNKLLKLESLINQIQIELQGYADQIAENSIKIESFENFTSQLPDNERSKFQSTIVVLQVRGEEAIRLHNMCRQRLEVPLAEAQRMKELQRSMERVQQGKTALADSVLRKAEQCRTILPKGLGEVVVVARQSEILRQIISLIAHQDVHPILGNNTRLGNNTPMQEQSRANPKRLVLNESRR